MKSPLRKPLAGARVGIFGKGGSGKSTLTVLLARALRRAAYEVSVVDADSTNVGLDRALGVGRSPRPLLEHYGGMIFTGGPVTCPVDDPRPLPGADISLRTLPDEYVGRTAEGIAVLVAGKMGEAGPGAGCDGPISKIARDVRVHAAGENHLTLLDFKAGFEDSARGVITGVDWALAVVDPTLAGIRMAVDLDRMVRALRGGAEPATSHLEGRRLADVARRVFREARIKGVLVVLNKVSSGETERYLRAALSEEGMEPIGVVPEDPGIPASWLKGAVLDPSRTGPVVEALARRLEEAVLHHEAIGAP